MSLEEKSQKNVYRILGLLLFLNFFAWVLCWNLSQVKDLEVVFFNVGQGDSIFIETPQHHQILIDGGPDSSVLQKLSDQMPFYDRSLDLIILSHPEKDHLFGLLEVLKRYKVENILWTGVVRDTAEWREWQSAIKKEGAEIKIVKAGQRIILQEENPKIYIDVLYPFENLEGKEVKDSNSTSIVARLTIGEKSFLFTGDIGKVDEEKLLDKNIDSDILKVAHHGSKYSSSEEFLKKVSPDIAVIQVGKNNYGHPAPGVLASLEKFGIKVLRTDINGDIKFTSDGKFKKINYKSKIIN